MVNGYAVHALLTTDSDRKGNISLWALYLLLYKKKIKKKIFKQKEQSMTPLVHKKQNKKKIIKNEGQLSD